VLRITSVTTHLFIFKVKSIFAGHMLQVRVLEVVPGRPEADILLAGRVLYSNED
jgi:hypothetical protein